MAKKNTSVTAKKNEDGSVVMVQAEGDAAPVAPPSSAKLIRDTSAIIIATETLPVEPPAKGNPITTQAIGDKVGVFIQPAGEGPKETTLPHPEPVLKAEKEAEEPSEEVSSDPVTHLRDLRTTKRRVPFLLKVRDELTVEQLKAITSSFDGDILSIAQEKLNQLIGLSEPSK